MRRVWMVISAVLAIVLIVGMVGAFLSAPVGRDALRNELEGQLSRLLQSQVNIREASFVFSRDAGLQIEAHVLSSYAGSSGPQLRVSRALAQVDVPSLVVGRFRLTDLLMEGVMLRVKRAPGIVWSPPFVENLVRTETWVPQDLERNLRRLRVFETVARFFLERGLLASHLELRRSRVTFVDSVVAPDGAPLTYVLDDISGTLAHSWITGETEMALRAYFINSESGRTPFEVEGRKGGDGVVHLALSTTEFQIHHLLPYASAAFPDARLWGRVSGVISIDSQARHHGRIEVEATVDELDIALRLREEPYPLSRDRVRLRSRLELHPGRLRIAHAELVSEPLEITLSGVVERPLRESSSMELAISLAGGGLRELQNLIDGLPPADREALTRLTERIASGRIVRIGGRGVARLAQWRRLLAGQLAELPEHFALNAEVADVVVGTSELDRLTELGASVEWRGDRIELSGAHALWDGEPLPTLSVAIDGFSRLLITPADERILEVEASPLPGLRTLWEMLGGGDSDGEPVEPPGVRVTVDELQHPAARWPIREAEFALEAIPLGLRLSVDHAIWAGSLVSGEGIWYRAPERHLRLEIRVAERQEVDPGTPSPLERHAPGTWLAGAFEVDGVRDVAVPYSSMAGRFSVRDSELEIGEMHGDLLPSGRFSASGSVALYDETTLPLAFRFDIEEGDVATLTEAVGFPADFARGRLQVMGSLQGTVRRDERLLEGLVGQIELRAGPGEVNRSLPVITAVANMSEGLSALGDVRFESIETTLEFDRGTISTDRFALDGPMRLVAEGSFDPARRKNALDLTVGIFLMRQVDTMLGNLPLVKHLTDSDKGLFGIYFALAGTWAKPDVKPLPLKSVAEGSLLSQIVQAPLRLLKEFEQSIKEQEREREPRPFESPLKKKGMRRPAAQPEGAEEVPSRPPLDLDPRPPLPQSLDTP